MVLVAEAFFGLTIIGMEINGRKTGITSVG
jgi:hypothetical protein